MFIGKCPRGYYLWGKGRNWDQAEGEVGVQCCLNKALFNLMESSGAGMALQSCPELRCGGGPWYPPIPELAIEEGQKFD